MQSKSEPAAVTFESDIKVQLLSNVLRIATLKHCTDRRGRGAAGRGAGTSTSRCRHTARISDCDLCSMPTLE